MCPELVSAWLGCGGVNLNPADGRCRAVVRDAPTGVEDDDAKIDPVESIMSSRTVRLLVEDR
jgi:hypothetical protein